MDKLSEFKAGCNNCRSLIEEQGESYARYYYTQKVSYSRSIGGSNSLVKAYWDGYYFVLTSLGYEVPKLHEVD